MTMHGTIMIFLWIVPVGAGFANYLIPLMIGAEDMAFPRLNAVAFWLNLPAGCYYYPVSLSALPSPVGLPTHL
jgi:cytochrome c oxidase subunit 1